ncbi:MAG TPA: glycosyltransferase family 4 protein [Vicinamibacterales bacterium]|nr:glycosyltransferase family 4 protein [Vicinamibacterales bacterium]
MKVGILCENYFPTLGGEQEHIYNLRRHLESPSDGSEPVDVRIIVPHVASDGWHGPKDDAHVLRPAHSLRIHGEGSASQITVTPSAYGALKNIFARERFDLLHIHAPVDVGLPTWALWTFDGPIVGTIHSYFTHTAKRNLLKPWYRYVMRRMTRVIAVSEAARDAMGRYARFESTIIGNGVDCAAFQAGRPIPRFADGMTNILSVARLEHRNGIDVMIDAFARLAEERPDIRLLLAGEGPGRGEYEAQCRRLPASIASRVMFLGAVWQERADLYASAHCYALGARKASFSILMLEALAAGLRVAALPGEGTSRAGEHWSLAEMASSETPDAYADALRRALAPATPDVVARAREMARRYDWSMVVPRIRRVYDEALAANMTAVSSSV